MVSVCKAIGIDLGTTYSKVGVYKNGKAEILADNFEERVIPSVVAYGEDVKTVGVQAKEEMPENPTNTIYGIKRMIGRQFDDPVIQEDIKNWPFKVVAGKYGRAAVEVEFKGEKLVKTPEEVSAEILKYLKVTAEKYFNEEVTDAVITVPANFTDSQKQATIDAGRIAGLNVLRIINEPTAAALAYGYKEKKKNKTILIYDLGGGTLDVAIIKVNDGKFDVLAVAGDSHLGGEDIDEIVMNMALKAEGKEREELSKSALVTLKNKCEKAKKSLSNTVVAAFKWIGEKVLNIKVKRDEFEAGCRDLFERTLIPVEKAMKDAGLTIKNIDDVVLIGGSTKIPYIKKKVESYFKKQKVRCDINPQEAVAIGATLCAANLSNVLDSSIQKLQFNDVLSHSLGYHCHRDRFDTSGFFRVVHALNTRFPCENYVYSCTRTASQTSACIQIYEGEDKEDVQKNKKLGSFQLQNIAPDRSEQMRVKITFKINENGILKVTASDLEKENSASMDIRLESGQLAEDEIQEMIGNLQVD